MLIPTKHTNFSESFLGFGSYILKKMESKSSIDSLWKEYQDDYQNEKYPSKHSFDNLIMTLIFLYSIGTIQESEGVISRCD